jgi:hypothetical protein
MSSRRRRRSSSGRFPTSPPAGAFAIYDARVGTTGATTLTGWADQSGNGRNVNYFGAAPQNNARTINGRNVIETTGAGGDGMAVIGISISTPATIVALGQSDLASQTGYFAYVQAFSPAAMQAGTQWGEGIWLNGTADLLPHVHGVVMGTAGTKYLVDDVVAVETVNTTHPNTNTVLGLAGQWGLPSGVPGVLSAGMSWNYDFSVAASITGSPSVTAVADQSPNAVHLTHSDGTTKAQTGVRTIGGKNALLFGGSADQELWIESVVAQPTTIYGVIDSDESNTGANIRKWYNGAGSGSGRLLGTQYLSDVGTGTPLAGGTIDTNPHVVCIVSNGASSLIEVDGITVATGTLGTTSTAYVEIGGDGGTGVGQVVGYPAAHNATLRAANRRFLGYKWGIPVA